MSTDDKYQDWMTLSEAGVPQKEIAARYGITPQAISHALRRRFSGRCGRCRKPRLTVNEAGLCIRCDRILAAARDIHLTANVAAQQAGVGVQVIQLERRRLGIKPANRGKYFRSKIPPDILDPAQPATELERKYELGRCAVYNIRKSRGIRPVIRPEWNLGPKWTAEDDCTLVRMRGAGKSWKSIGSVLNRGFTACQARIQNVKNGRSKPEPGSPLMGLYPHD